MDARLIARLLPRPLPRLLLLCLALCSGSALSQTFDHEHEVWDGLLKKHVAVLDGGRASQLRYAGMARDHAALKEYLEKISAVKDAEFDRWSRPLQEAFLINAYNAFTVEKVLSRYPDIKSIWDFGKLFGNPFKDRFFTLLGKKSSLDDIEHGLLRRNYREPRVHFALNCASVGCPMLRGEAYVGYRLERQLEEQAVRFLSDRSRNRFTLGGPEAGAAAGTLQVSKIFDWYKEDFEPRAQYFARYAKVLAEDPAGQQLIASGKAPLSFLEYDWALNDARK
jgi:hypothetical protein